MLPNQQKCRSTLGQRPHTSEVTSSAQPRRCDTQSSNLISFLSSDCDTKVKQRGSEAFILNYVISYITQCFVEDCSRNQEFSKVHPEAVAKAAFTSLPFDNVSLCVVRFWAGCYLLSARSAGHIAWGFGKLLLFLKTLSLISATYARCETYLD